MSERGLPVLPGEIPAEVPYLRLPRAARVFLGRAERLRALALGHAAGDWLSSLAVLCDAQHEAAVSKKAALDLIVVRMLGAPWPAPAKAALARLAAAETNRIASWMATMRGEHGESPEPAAVPFLGAALQVEATLHAQAVAANEIPRAAVDCPVCAAPAVAGIVQGDDRVRYLTCGVCASSWHRTRVLCATCGASGKVSYFAIDHPSAKGVKAEACGACGTYLKLFYREERPEAEPVADDLATLALDLLMGDEGFARGGTNWLLAP